MESHFTRGVRKEIVDGVHLPVVVGGFHWTFSSCV